MADFTGAQYAADEVLAGIKKNQITGLPPSDLTTFSGRAGDQKATITWEVPKQTIIDGMTLCTAKGLTIRRSTEAAPATPEDGDLVLSTTNLSGSYEDTGLVNDQTYYYSAFPYSDHGVQNISGENTLEVTPKAYTLLGFRIKKAESDPAARVEYTEMAAGHVPATRSGSTFDLGSFASYWFVTDNKPCMVRNDGTVDYYLNPNDYTLKESGGASDVSNTAYAGNAMAQIPRVWMKCWEDSTYEYVNFCDIQLDDTYKAYAHTRADGSVAEFVYLSLFEGSLTGGKVRSIKGLSPMNSQTGTNELNYAKANGTLWSTRSWSQRNLINMLLVLMFKTTNLQAAVGNGYYTGGSSSSPNYLQTGGASNKGQFYGSTATRDYVKVFHLENWWGDVWERIEGCVTNGSSRILIKPTPGYNTSGSGYTDTGVTPSGTSGGFISAHSMKDYGLVPKTASGSDSTYIPDGLWWAASCYAVVGGSSAGGLLVGPFALDLGGAVSVSSWGVGAALSCQQPTA